MKKKLWILSFLMAIVFLMAGANLASAYTITASSLPGSTSADVNPGPGGGLSNWIIGESGASQLELQWFWFKVGDVVTRLGDDMVTPDTTIVPVIDVTYDPTPGNDDQIEITYDYNGLNFYASYAIDGGYSPPYGHIHEVIQVTNDTIAPISMRLYEYNDFDLVGTPEDDIAVADSQYAILQYEGNKAISEVSRSIGAFATGGYEIDDQPDLMATILAGDALDNTPPVGTEVEYDDTAWAFSWDFNLNPDGGSFSLSKDKIVITPVPTTLLLFGSGLFSLIGVGIRRRKS